MSAQENIELIVTDKVEGRIDIIHIVVETNVPKKLTLKTWARNSKVIRKQLLKKKEQNIFKKHAHMCFIY